MKSMTKKRAELALKRLNKSGTTVYDGITPNAPHNIIDSYRPQEISEVRSRQEKYYLDNLELSKRLMKIDYKYYGVDEESASALIDYIEQGDFDIIVELEMEYNIQKKALKENEQSILSLELGDFVSPDDYKRDVAYKIRELKVFQKKLMYLKMIIKTIREFQKELMDGEEELRESRQFPDFSFTGTNYNSPIDGAGKLK